MLNKKIGVIVHGPGIIDSGYAKKIIKLLKNYGHVSARLGGTMGRTAVLDANLEGEINITKKLLPTESIQLLNKDNDILFLLNYGKSTVTGHTFGYKIFNKSNKTEFIQIERPGEEDGVIIPWTINNDSLISIISDKLNLEIVSKHDVIQLVENKTGFTNKGNVVKRKIAGVSPGENIMVNGVIIGKITSSNLTIVSENKIITKLIGGVLKGHGVDKLQEVDIKTAIVKTGLLRTSSDIQPRKIIHKSKRNNIKICYLDHSSEDIYKYISNMDLILTIGDDTTLLSSDILYRFNIPIIGITDGDLDKIVETGYKLDKSIIIQVKTGYDDIVGSKIHKTLFNDKSCIVRKDIFNFKTELFKFLDSLNIDYDIVNKQLK